MAALNAAREAGATYADIRIDSSVSQGVSVWFHNEAGPATYDEELTYGIRVVANGQWGFAGDQYPSLEAAANCARLAVTQAKVNAPGRKQSVELAPVSPVMNGSWATPIEIDPFAIPIGTWQDTLIDAVRAALAVKGIRGASASLSFSKTVRTFASTDGSFILQTFWNASPGAFVYAGFRSDGQDGVSRSVTSFGPAQKGYEVVRAIHLADEMVAAAEAAVLAVPSQPLAVGRYDIVVSPSIMASLVTSTLGALTSMDRAGGRQVHYRGTTFLGAPQTVLGTPITSPLISLIADRNSPDGLASVHWDDEGVSGDAFPLIEHGTLVDYQTTRESAVALSDWYQRHGRPVRSHGCAAGGGLTAPRETLPNLTITPGPSSTSVHDLISGIAHGFYFSEQGSTSLDDQLLRGQLNAASVQEIRNGHLVGYVRDAVIEFRTPDLWKSLDAIGGQESQQSTTTTGSCTVRAVPGRFRQIAISNSGLLI